MYYVQYIMHIMWVMNVLRMQVYKECPEVVEQWRAERAAAYLTKAVARESRTNPFNPNGSPSKQQAAAAAQHSARMLSKLTELEAELKKTDEDIERQKLQIGLKSMNKSSFNDYRNSNKKTQKKI